MNKLVSNGNMTVRVVEGPKHHNEVRERIESNDSTITQITILLPFDYNLEPTDIEKFKNLMQSLAKNTTIKHITIDYCYRDTDGVGKLIPYWNELLLSNHFITSVKLLLANEIMCQMFFDALQTNTQITQLAIRLNQSIPIHLLTNLFRLNHSITELELSLQDANMNEFGEFLKTNSTLLKLIPHIPSTELERWNSILVKSLQENTTLTQIETTTPAQFTTQIHLNPEPIQLLLTRNQSTRPPSIDSKSITINDQLSKGIAAFAELVTNSKAESQSSGTSRPSCVQNIANIPISTLADYQTPTSALPGLFSLEHGGTVDGRPLFGFQRQVLGRATGAKELGCSLYIVQPGQSAWPYHRHCVNEEAIFILSGEGKTRIDEKEYSVGTGDYISMVIGVNHQLTNTHASVPLIYLCVATKFRTDLCPHPDSNKIEVYSSGERDQIAFSLDSKEGKSVPYFYGENGTTRESPESKHAESTSSSSSKSTDIRPTCIANFNTLPTITLADIKPAFWPDLFSLSHSVGGLEAGTKQFGFHRKLLGRMTGGKQVGSSLYLVEPGKSAWPFHHHSVNEEAILILSGKGQTRMDDHKYEVGAGDYIAMPTRVNHQLINTHSTEPLIYLCFSTNHPTEITTYPDSNKLGLFGDDGQIFKFISLADGGKIVPYFHGEGKKA